MKVILYNAITIDGFIATSTGDSEWVSPTDVEIFDKKIKEIGCIVMGGKTFRQFKGEYFPKKGVLNIIVTSDDNSQNNDNVVFVKSPTDAIKIAEEEGFGKIMLIGGGTTNTSFLKQNLIDEMYFDVHPLVFGKGIKVFQDYDNFLNIELIDSTDLGTDQVLLHYKVIK